MTLLPEQYMEQACLLLGLVKPQIVATDRFRWTIDSDDPKFHLHMLKLERHLQSVTGRPIDLRLEPESDKNKRKNRNVLSAGLDTK